MKLRRIVTICLIGVMAFQLLPVKQAVQYFFIDNLIIEEILHVNKNATKNFRLLDEDHFIVDGVHCVPSFSIPVNIAFFQFAEALPVSHPTDIQTPPPNGFPFLGSANHSI